MDFQTIERVKKGLNDPRIGPETIALMLTGVCNFNCIYCRGGRTDARPRIMPGTSGELSTEDLFSLFEDARGFQVKEINLGGMSGEPFCKKDILKIINKIKQLSLMGSMTTNGSFLNAEIARAMTDCNWDILLLSLDSAEPDVQHRLRPAQNLKPYFQNIVGFLEELGRIKSRLRILLNVVVSRFNYRGLPDLVRFSERYQNIESVNILKMLNMGLHNYEKIQLNAPELEEFKSILLNFKGQDKIKYAGNWVEEREEPKNEPQDFNRCFTNFYILSIDSNGDILHCPQHQRVVEGLNIRKKPLRELWRDEHLRFRRALAQNAPCFNGCCTILKEQNKSIFGTVS